MELKTYFAQDASGNIMPGAAVTVYIADTLTLATGLLDENESALTNPFNADSDAKVAFYAPDGLYDINVVSGIRSVTIRAQFVGIDAAIVLRDDLAETSGATLVGADDSASGTLFTTVAGLISRLRSSAGSALVGFIQGGTGAVARTSQDKLREAVSVKDFGAVGDGATDDTAAIQAALDHASSVYRDLVSRPKFLSVPLASTVRIPDGTYKVGTLIIPVGVMLEGHGPGSVLQHTGGGSDCVVIQNNRSAIPGTDRFPRMEGVRNLTILGAMGAGYSAGTYAGQIVSHGTRYGVYVNEAFHNTVVENITTIYCRTGIVSRYQLYGKIKNCRAEYSSGDGIFVEYASNLLNIEGSVAYFSGGHGINVVNTGQPNAWNITLRDCDAEYSGLSGVQVIDVKKVTLENCYIEVNNTGARDGAITGEVWDVVFGGNTAASCSHSMIGCFVNSQWNYTDPGTGNNISSVNAGPLGSVTLIDSVIVNSGAAASALRVGKNAKVDLINSRFEVSGGAVPLRVEQSVSGVYEPGLSSGIYSLRAQGGSKSVTVDVNDGEQHYLPSLTGTDKFARRWVNGTEIEYILGDTNRTRRYVGDFIAGGTNAAQGVLLQRDGTTGGGLVTAATNNANIVITPTGTGTAVLLGKASFRPPASSSPGVNGEITIEFTNNTTLTFRARGSDGVTRSGSVTLA